MGDYQQIRGVELNNITRFSLDFLLKIGFIKPNEAIDLEVQILIRNSSKAINNNLFIARIFSLVRPEYLKELYSRHLKKRAISKHEYCLPTIKLKDHSYYEIEKASSNAMALPCSRCNYLYAELRVSWFTDEIRMLEMPSYNVYCSMCGYSKGLTLSDSVIDFSER